VKKNLANYLGFSMKVIKLFITSILLLSSFQAFAFSITTGANISTPENTAKVIDLTTDVTVGDIDSLDFAILSGADANKFTLKGNHKIWLPI
jgi:hypothetical protein